MVSIIEQIFPKQNFPKVPVKCLLKVIPLSCSTIKLFLKLVIVNIHDMKIKKMQ